MRRKAFVVGVDNYADENIPNLRCARNDAVKIYSEFYANGFECHGLFDEQADDLEDQLVEFTADLQLDDIFVFYFSGHGCEIDDIQYLMRRTAGSSENALRAHKGLTAINQVKAATDIPGVKRFFIFDCCRNDIISAAKGVAGDDCCSGGFAKGLKLAIERTVERPAVIAPVYLLSCDSGQCSYEDRVHKQGFFTGAFLGAIRDESVRNVPQFRDVFAGKMNDLELKGRQDPCWIGNLEREILLLPRWDSKAKSRPAVAAPAAPAPDYSRHKKLFEEAKAALAQGDADRAVELLEEAGDYAPALNLLGDLFEKGKEVIPDLKKAFRCYKRSAALKDAEGQCKLGLCHYSDRWGERNHEKAYKLFERSAQQGYLDAIYYAGYCCEMGHGTPKNLVKAAEFYKNAADKGHMRAQYSYALCCTNGWGRAVDNNLAVQYYRMAADQNYHRAQFNLGCCYASGVLGEKKYEKAVEYYRLSAVQGNSKAQYCLARCLETGRGCDQNINEAIYWYKSAARDSVEAQNCLARLQKSIL